MGLCLIFFVHYVSKIRVFRDMQAGRTAIARWTLPAAQFSRFCEEERRIPPGSIMVNFYKPPRTVPADGVEVIFSSDGVLIGDGYFPLSPTGGRRLQSVRYIASDPPAIEFGMAFSTKIQTFTYRALESLRVPVATDHRSEAGTVVRRYQAIIGRL